MSNLLGSQRETGRDRQIAQTAAEKINAYWRERGVDANARVGLGGVILSNFSPEALARASLSSRKGRRFQTDADKARLEANERRRALVCARVAATLREAARPMTLKEVSRAAGLSYSNADVVLKRMMKAGVIERFATQDIRRFAYRLVPRARRSRGAMSE